MAIAALLHFPLEGAFKCAQVQVFNAGDGAVVPSGHGQTVMTGLKQGTRDWALLSPDGCTLVRFLVCDGYKRKSEKDAHLQFRSQDGFADCFEHINTIDGSVSQVHTPSKVRRLPSNRLAYASDAGGLAVARPVSHPFLCSWMQGTGIYAGAAVGYVWVVSTISDQILSCWDAADLAAVGNENIADVIPGAFASTPFARYCDALSWSKDRTSLAVAAFQPVCVISQEFV